MSFYFAARPLTHPPTAGALSHKGRATVLFVKRVAMVFCLSEWRSGR
jgi:hypothetical protein